MRLVEPAAFTKVSALGVEEQRVNVIADLLTPPDQRRSVGDSFRVEARIIVWQSENALKVPAGALFRQGDDWAALVVSDGRTELRKVKVGRSSSTESQILDGLKEGEERRPLSRQPRARRAASNRSRSRRLRSDIGRLSALVYRDEIIVPCHIIHPPVYYHRRSPRAAAQPQ